MRWDGQAVAADDGALPGLERPGLARLGLVRTVRTPEFAGVQFHEVLARSALTKVPAASRMPFRWTVNPYRGCSHACRYCLSPETPVLLADGRRRPIADLRVGDRVIGTERIGTERIGTERVGTWAGGTGRRYVVTTVEARWTTVRRAHRLTLADGTVIVASGDHRFLAGDGRWRHVAPAIRPQAPRPVLGAGDALAGAGAAGAEAILGARVVPGSGLRVVSIEDLGHEQEMLDITTGTGDFVANGVVSHNCFARPTHEYLDLDAGADFDSQVVVKMNVDSVLRSEVGRPTWRREPVALGTNTDPYQRAEGRYRLMPGIIGALADSGTPFSILTKGTLLRRDLPLIADSARRVEVGIGVSLAFADEELQQAVEPGTPTPRARLDLVRAVRSAGLPCGVMVAPVLPWLTDSTDHLRRLLDAIAGAGATGVTVVPLHLKPGTREWYLGWLEREHPRLVAGYGRVFRRTYVREDYRAWLWDRVHPLLDERGFGASGHRARSGATGRFDDELRPHDDGDYPAGAMVGTRAGGGADTGRGEGQQALF